MSLQNCFNRELLSKLKKIKKAIELAKGVFEVNQMICATLRAALMSLTPVAYMDREQLLGFEDNLINIFTYNNWLIDNANFIMLDIKGVTK